MVSDDHVALFKFWLSEGYRFRRRTSHEMQSDPKKYKARLRHEFDIITTIPGYVDYFLIVSDLVRWAKDQGIAVGPGRGSAAGSLCCYLLRITELDPLQYPMLFERFIDVNRTDLPDIDIDFEDERRHEVIRYAQEKYGNDRVANILNFVRYKADNSLNDIGTVYRIPDWVVQRFKEKIVPQADGHPRFSNTIEDAIAENPELASFLEEYPALEYATELEGNYRHTSIHPAGIVIAGDDITNYCATYEKQSGGQRGSGIAYDKKDSEYLGLLKVDFLSLRALTGIRATLDAIGMTLSEFYEIPLDDPKVYEAFRNGDVLGIFQFEGMATRRVLQQIAPTKFMDLVDVNALSRPGGDDKAYVKAKNSGVLPDYPPVARQHLEWTYGTIVYQEQILLILRDLGNFEPAAVNRIRKAISAKQDATEFNVYREQFVEGAATHGVTREKSLEIWHLIVQASGYSFNISHAACYSDTAYRQMWLKVYHPEFYLGQLQKCPDDDEGKERRRKLIIEAENKGLKVNPPKLEVSRANWVLHDNQLYAGWSAIKGIGPKMAENIVLWRDGRLSQSGQPGQPGPIDLQWDDLLQIAGIGPGRVETVRSFCESDDPFGVLKTKRLLDSIRNQIETQSLPGLITPTHCSLDITQPDRFVVFLGVVKEKRYYDLVKQKLKYGPEGLTREKILETIEDPHLLKYAALVCEDEFDEPVRVQISRKKYPQFASMLSKVKEGHHVVLVKGFTNEFNGIRVYANDLVFLEP